MGVKTIQLYKVLSIGVCNRNLEVKYILIISIMKKIKKTTHFYSNSIAVLMIWS